MRIRESASRDLDTSTWDVRRSGVEVFWCESMAEEQDEQQQQNMLDVELVPINNEQVGLAGDLGSINDVLILLVRTWTVDYFNFQQDPDETLYQAWEQFKELLLRCPKYYLIDMQEAADVRKSIQKMADYFLKWHNKTSTRCRSIETSNGLGAIQAQLNNLGREIKKVNEKVYAAQVGCELCKEPHYTKDCPLKEERKTLEDSYYSQFGVPFPQGGQYRAAAPEFYLRNNGNHSYQERRKRMEESLSKNQRASIKALEIQIGQMSKELQEKGSRSLPSSTKTNSRDHVKSISTTVETDTFLIHRIGPIRYAVSSLQNKARVSVMPFSTYTKLRLGELAPTKLIVELADRTVKHPKGIAKNVLVWIDKFVFPVDFIVLDMPEDIKTPLILGRPFLSTAHAKTDVVKRKITLRIGNEKVVFKSDKPTSSIIKRVYALSLRERLELNLEARLMGKALILNRSLDPLYRDYIKLNEPLELRRNRVDNLEPTIEEGYEHVNANFFHLLSINVMSKSFYNSIIKDKVEFKGKIVVRAFMNVPIFVGKFSTITDFIVVENIDSYRDERMGDIVVGRPFCKEALKIRRIYAYTSLKTTKEPIRRITSITVNGKNAYELKRNFLDDLCNNAITGTNEEDAVEHIEYFLKNIDPIDLPNVNQDKLRVVVFPISLVGDAWRWFD
nr:hypothetical protein [Tanacetum cinerariifolium]